MAPPSHPRRQLPDLDTLDAYLAVYSSGSMTVAAQQFGQTQSAMSRQIARLESQLGVQLFERHSRPLVPTAAGRRLAEAAESLMSQAAALKSEVAELDGRPMTRLRLGVVDSLSDPLVPELIRSTRHLITIVSVMTGFVGPLRHKLIKHELDALISADALDDQDGFDRHEILGEQFVVLAPRGDPPFHDEDSFRRFASTAPMIRSSASTGIAQRIEQQFRRTRLVVPEGFSCDTIDSIVSFVAADLGWTILTPTCLRKCVGQMPFLQVLPLPGIGFSRRIYLVVRENELDNVKPLLTDASRDIIRRKYLPSLNAIAPWLAEAVTIAPRA